MCFNFLYKCCLKHLILRTEQKMIKMYKVPGILVTL